MSIFLLSCLCSFIALMTAQKFANTCPKGLRGLPPGHSLEAKGKLLLIGSMLLFALNNVVLLLVASTVIKHPEHPLLLVFAASLFLPAWFSLKAILLVKNGTHG